MTTDADGYWRLNSTMRKGRKWRVRWHSPTGATWSSPPVQAYRAR